VEKAKKYVEKAKTYLGKGGSFIWSYFGLARGTAWCVAFGTYIFWKLGWKKHWYDGKPVFYVPYIEEWLHAHAQHVKMADARAGDICICTWTGGGNNARNKGKCSRDHFAIIRKKGTSQTAYTIEGNTSGGIVANRTRALTNVFAIYRIDLFQIKQAKKEIKKAAKKKATQKAIDISTWQGKLSVANFKDVKEDGCNLVIFKASGTWHKEKFDTYKDAVFAHNIENAIKAGLKVAAYHYSQATSVAEAEKEAKFFLDIIKPYKKHIQFVAFDWEKGGRLSYDVMKRLGKTNCTKVCEAFCSKANDAGYATMVYANYNTFANYLNKTSIKKFAKIWLAQYGKKAGFTDYDLWQYSDSGKVAGIKTAVDVNRYPKSKQLPKNGYTGKLPTSYQSVDHYTVAQTKRWQKFLNWYFGKKVVTVDGIYGPKTKGWTIAFQKKVFASEAEWDGIAGIKTIRRAGSIKK